MTVLKRTFESILKAAFVAGWNAASELLPEPENPQQQIVFNAHKDQAFRDWRGRLSGVKHDLPPVKHHDDRVRGPFRTGGNLRTGKVAR